MYHDNKYATMSKTAKNIYARSFMIEIPEIHRTIEHRVMFNDIQNIQIY